jgi:hypothetical protein
MPAITYTARKSTSRKLNANDYKNILHYYHIDQTTPNTRKQPLKKQIETILAQKLCSCIKKLNQTVKTSGKRAESNRLLPVPVCINNVIKRKHLKIFKFTCKNKKQLLPKAGTTQVLGKTIAQLNLGKKTLINKTLINKTLINKTKKTRRNKIK